MSRTRHLSFSAELEEASTSSTSLDFVTPQYDPSSLDQLNPADISLDDDEEYDETEEEESERYSRQRSRSRSFNEHDGDTPISIVTPVDLSTFSSQGTANAAPKKEETTSSSGGERSGPLQQREVMALKKGLEEATLTRNQEELIEEEEEKRAAESEKKKRQLTAQLAVAHPEISNPSSEIQMRRVKILILGDSGVGKSSLIMRWTADTFSANIVGTVGVNFKTKKVYMNNENIQVQVWDTAGQEHFHKITTSYYRGAHGIMLVYDVADARTMDNAEYWIKNIKAHASDTVRVALIGNKADLRSCPETRTACTDPKLATVYAEKFGVPYFETSAKDATNVDVAFTSMVEGVINNVGSSFGCTNRLAGMNHYSSLP